MNPAAELGRPCDRKLAIRERLLALKRTDKWYLGGLDGVVWAPPFPAWLHRPGYWDPAHLLHLEIGPCFSVALLDGDGREIMLRRPRDPDGAALRAPSPGPGGPYAVDFEPLPPGPMAWRPGKLTLRWAAIPSGDSRLGAEEDLRGPAAVTAATEIRRVLPGGVLESSWTLAPWLGARTLVVYTAQPADAVSALSESAEGVTWLREVVDRTDRALTVRISLSGPIPPTWRRAVPSEGAALPDWEHTPFAEGDPSSDGFAVPARDSGSSGWIWAAVAFPLSAVGGAPISVALSMEPASGIASSSATSTPDTRRRDPPDWESFFGGFPSFKCGDPRLDRYFDYRIYGLGQNRTSGRWDRVRHPAIAEGPAYFHVPIAYSAQCHMMEMRWRKGGREAWGSLLNFLDNQKENGSLHGRLYPHHSRGTDFYHSNWGDALLAVHDLHPNRPALDRCYEGLSRYARWLDRERDPENSGMFTVLNHFETGQEYMSRYMAVDEEADVSGWLPKLRLKGIDVTVYAHQLFRALEKIATRLGRLGDRAEWDALRTRSAQAITGRMWSPDEGIFTDVDARTWERTGVKAAVGFYPLLTGLVGGSRLDGLLDHLEDPATFGTPFPLPSSSVDDPRFSAEGIWRGKRRNCPWNGRVWPMTTSHVVEGLLRCRRAGGDRAGRLAAEKLPRFVRMMFADGDPSLPNCFEHYNPYTGRACRYRGIDDYQHSWVLDLLIRGVAGLHVSADGLEVWPLPHAFEDVALGPVATRGVELRLRLTRDSSTLAVDNAWFAGPRDRPLKVSWAEAGLEGGREAADEANQG